MHGAQYNLKQLYWLLDHIYVDNTEDASLNTSVLHQVLKNYGGVTDTNAIINNVTTTDLYAINQNLIWLIINNGPNGKCWDIIRNNSNLLTIYNAYVNGINRNANYSRYTSNNINISNSNAEVLENGVVGPFKINGNGGMYNISTSGNVNGTAVTTNLYKDKECKNKINSCDNYYGDVFVKLENFKKNTQVSVSISLKHSYITEGRFWYTQGQVDSGKEPQPLISFKRATTTINSEKSGKYVTGSYHMNIAKKSKSNPNGSSLSGAVFNITKQVADESKTEFQKTTTGAEYDNITGEVDIKNTSACDYYTIHEDSAPQGYNSTKGGKDSSGNRIGWTIGIRVYKGLNSTNDKLSITKIELYGGSPSKTYASITPGGVAMLDTNLKLTTNATDCVIKLDLATEGGAFTFTWQDEPLSGDYDLQIVKKDDTQNWTSAGANDGIEGAVFNVRQYLNIDDSKFKVSNDIEKFLKDLTPSNKTVTSITDAWETIYDDVKINTDQTVDLYAINEEEAPDNYEKNSNTMYLKVYKKVNNSEGKYYIDKVEMLSAGNVVMDGTGYSSGVVETGQERPGISGETEDDAVYTYFTHLKFKFKVSYNKGRILIYFSDSPILKEGTYNFQLTKTDVSGEIIENEKTEFSVEIYDNVAIDANNKVSYGNKVTLKDSKENVIDSSKLTAITGVTTGLNEIQIQKEDIGKTYYFIITETVAPDEYTAIDYKVAVPVTFSEQGSDYIATKQTAFAIDSSGYKKSLSDVAADTNSVVQDTQVDATINVTVPNVPVKEGTYDFKLTKIDSESKNNINETTVFSVDVYNNITIANSNKVTLNSANLVTLKNDDGDIPIETMHSLSTTTGITSRLNGLKIKAEDVNKTYYFVITETDPPDDYTKINYRVVVPVKFTESGRKYIATKQTAFAIDSSGYKRSLSEVATNTNSVVQDTQVDATINVTVPNVPVEEGTYDVNLVKKGTDGSYLAGVKFDLTRTVNNKTETFNGNNQITTTATETGVAIKNKNEAIVRGTSQDTYILKETSIGDNDDYYIGITDSIKLNVNKSYKRDGNKIVNYVNGIVLIVGDTRATEQNGVYTVTKNGVSITAKFDNTTNIITITVENPKMTEEGTYDVNLVKKGTDGSYLAGVKFELTRTVNNKTVTFNGNNQITTTATETGVAIKNKNEAIVRGTSQDTYILKETSIGDNNGYYIGITDSIKLIVNKSYRRDENKIINYVNGIVLIVGDTRATEQNGVYTLTKNGVSITAKFDNDTNIITITVQNPKIKGDYSIQAKKVDEKENPVPVYGDGAAEFSLKVPGSTTDLFKPTNYLSKIATLSTGYTIAYTKEITKDNVNAEDTYLLTEETAPTGYMKLKNPLTLKITKAVISKDDKKIYAINKITVIADNDDNKKVEINCNGQSGSAVINNVLLNDNVTTAMVTINVNVSGEITVQVENKELTGSYNLQIYKELKSKGLPGIQFTVTGAKSANLQTNANGYTGVINKTITKADVNNIDSYTITEVDSGNSDIIKLKNPIKIDITKGENSSKTKLVMKHISAYESGKTTKFESDVSENAPTTITISNVELKNGTKVNLTLTVNVATDSEVQKAVLKVVNDEEAPKTYQLKIKKIDRDKEGTSSEGLSNRKFNVYKCDPSNLNNRTLIASNLVTDGNGYVTIGSNFELKNGIDTYIIQEVYNAGVSDEYIQIKDYEWKLVITKTGNSVSTYKIASTSVLTQLRSGATEDSVQKSIADEATATIDSNNSESVTITIKNQKYNKFSFDIRKVDTSDNEINGTKFKVIRAKQGLNSALVLSNIDPNDPDSVITTENVLPGETYQFRIYETSTISGYKSLFYDNTGYVRVDVVIDSNGNVDKSATKIVKWNLPITNYQTYIDEYLQKSGKTSILEINNNEIKLNLPNPKDETNMELKLNKHSYGNTGTKLAGVKFALRRSTSVGNVTDVSTMIRLLNNYGEDLTGFTTNADDDSKIDSLDKAIVNTSYIYEIEETETLAKHDTKIEKAIVRIYVKEDKSSEAKIAAVKLKGESGWRDYSHDISYADRIGLVSNGGNSYTINWANDNVYEMHMYKKGIESGDVTTLPKNSDGSIAWSSVTGIQANFTIKQISPTQKDLVTNQKIGSYDYVTDEAQVGTQYVYTLVENSPDSGYQNLFEGVTIKLYVTLNDDGTINSASNATYIKLEGCDSATSVYLNNFIKLEVVDNKIELYILNPKDIVSIKLLKVSGSKTDSIQDAEKKGISGVTFWMYGTGENGQRVSLGDNGLGTTDDSGYITVDNVSILGSLNKQYYFFTEKEVPDGITKLENTEIQLTINTEGISSASEITQDRLTISANMIGAGGTNNIANLNVKLVGKTIIVIVPNPTNQMWFKLDKKDVDGNFIRGTVNDTAVKMAINKIADNEQTLVFDGIMGEGSISDGWNMLKGNSEYTYILHEKATQAPYINIFNGYYIYLHLKTDAEGIIKPINPNHLDQSNGNSYYEIKGTGRYATVDEILEQSYLEFELDTTNSERQYVTVKMVNPPSYRVQLNKRDLQGNPAQAYIEATNTSKSNLKVILENTDTMNYIRPIYIKDGEEQQWQIKETSARSPYYNVLEGKIIYATTKWENGQLVISNWNIDGKTDSEYKKYVDISTQKIDSVWTLVVTVKDPIKIKIRLNKVGENGQPLAGAKLKLISQQTNETLTIEDGTTSTDYIEEEAGIGTTCSYTITEIKSTVGHVNMLEGKTLILTFRMYEDKKMHLVQTVLIGSNGEQITGEEKTKILEYIDIDYSESNRNEPIVDITVKNPVQLKVKLTKIDSSGNLLDGTQITVKSPISGTHYLNKQSSLEFTDEGLEEGIEYIYDITEEYTKGGDTGEETPYINTLENAKIKLALSIEDTGKIKYNAYVLKKNLYTGQEETINISEIGGSCEVSEPDSSGIQTVNIVIENPTSFKFEVTKKQAGDNGSVLPRTKFSITSSESGIHEGYTDSSGIISYTESEIKAGDYTLQVREEATTYPNYVNILGDNYIEINVHVDADGNVTFKDEAKKYRICWPNGIEVTDANELAFYQKYIEVNIDKSSKINNVQVTVKNPVKIGFQVHKISAGTTPIKLQNAEFSVINEISNKTTTLKTNNKGLASVDEDIVDPGVYKYEITEIKTAKDVYNNILEGYKIVTFVKVNADGSIELVRDKNGNAYPASNVNKRFYIYKGDTDVTNKTEGIEIKKFITIDTYTTSESIQRVEVTVENPIKYKIDLVKKDSAGNELRRIFSVYRDEELVFNNNVTSDVEVVEDNMSAGHYVYHITESSSESSAYVNVLKDKYIVVGLTVKSSGEVVIDKDNSGNKFSIYDLNTKTIISRDDEVYDYVNVPDVSKDENGIYVVKVEVENPTQHKFRIIKKDASESSIIGSRFTAYKEDSEGTVTKIVDNEEPGLKEETPVRAGNYIYYITENKTPGTQYINILEGKYIKLYFKVEANGRVYITNSKFQPVDGYYELYEGDIEQRNGTKISNNEYISVNVASGITYTLEVNVKNPTQYNVDVIKKDTSGGNLSGAEFTVRRKVVKTDISTEIFSGKVSEGVEANENPMLAGNYIYYITETKTPGTQYTNVLEGEYIKLYIKVDGDGTVTITDSSFKNPGYYELYRGDVNNPKDTDEQLSTRGPTSGYIKVYLTKDSDNIYTINVKITNPTKIKVKVNKKIFGNEAVNLENVVIKAYGYGTIEGKQELITDKDGNISFMNNYINEGIIKYVITEAKPAGDEFVNVLENKEIVVYVKANADGTIQIVDESEEPAENKYYVYDTTDTANKVKLDETTNIIKEFISVGTSTTEDGIAQLDFAIKNPQKYDFRLVKIDKDTKKAMNGVKFSLTVKDESGEIVTLKNASTLEPISTDEIETSEVDGVNGVINIDNILIEKAGKYTFVLHEESTDGIFDWLYKGHREDIVINANIIVENGKYKIGGATISAGANYISELEFTSTIGVGVTNERIKGKYNLTLNKIDSYTEENLDGAVFDIDVQKDGESYQIYKSTDDVESKEIIIPTTVTVENGSLTIENIRIERPETYTIILKEISPATGGYMLLDEPIVLEVTTNRTGLENYDDEKFILESVELVSGENYGLVSMDYDEDEIEITAKNEYFDLSLRKSITSISYPDSDEAKITEDETKNRIPEVITDDLIAGNDTTAIYNHKKDPLRVYKGQDVIYTLRVYNEGEIDGYAEEITDHLPEWLEFVNDDFNAERGWKLDESDATLRTVKTANLSKQYGEEHNIDNLIKARNKVTGELDYKEIQIKCRVSDKAKVKTVLTNIAEISKSVSIRTSETIDRDSGTNNIKLPETSEEWSKYKDDKLTKSYIPGQEDDDDFEKVIVEEFDLALRKYITAINDEELLKTEDETTEETEEESTNDGEDTTEETTDDVENTTEENTNDGEDLVEEDNTNADEIKYAREPLIDVTPLKDESSTTATKTHTKEPIEVSVDDIVTYTISVYNEGTVPGYATLIKDDIPEGLEFVKDSKINKEFRWKLLDENNKETEDVTKAKYIVSDYLSRENGEDNLLNAFDGNKLDTRYVQVDFKVICKQDYPKIIENQAQISDDTDESGKAVRDRDSVPDEWNGEDDEDVEYIKVTYLDLALRKFITSVNGKSITDRIPQVDATALINRTGTTAKYSHTKEPVIVHTTDIVTYTLRVYNEASKDGYATLIKDDIPDGLEFLPDNETNKKYEWKLVDENDNEVTDISKAKYVVTDYLSKDKETEERQNLIKSFDETTMKTPDFKDVKIAFKVVEPTTSDRILINYAQISKETDGKGIPREDRDSTPNEWKGEDDEDIEKVRVLYFDLALRKWVTKAIVIQNGQENVTETGHHAEDDPEGIVKVDLKKSKINDVVVKFEYQIRVTNEGEIAGYAKEVKDRIPEGLRFDPADNPNWVQLEENIVTTDELKDTLLQPGESAEVTIVLTWINSETNMGVKVNVAEISKDYNEYETPDIDSTPDNNVPGEDDIDDAPVMLTIKTGANEFRYMMISLGILAIIALGVSVIKESKKEGKNK